ncbi:AMP-binding protein [Virgibacillus necropolis]|uniref:Acyl-CoA synthetase n=1 Tax=Virgibacillus necropolis TaxID=163877 RepID=A0A221MHN7_9BACI|nr:AMP-binding protein [Virgibacillus necropolis]ASN07154.1 hypothetical protein CFK40_20180 [Virgibacillus necropolis]
MGIGKNMKQIAQKHPRKTAIYFDDKKISYGDFYRSICQLRQNLEELSQEKQSQKVAILIGNEPAFLELFFAVVAMGWVAIPFDPKWSRREAVQIMDEAEPDLLITSKSFFQATAYSFDCIHYVEDLKRTTENTNTNVWNVFSNEHFYLGFTSGSTGTPKGFIRNHESWLASFIAAEKAFHYNHDDIIIAPGPLCHSLSLFGAVHALHIGASFYLTPSFSAESTFDILSDGRATVIYAVPTMLHGLAQQTGSTNKKIPILSSGAKLTPKIKNKLQKTFPAGRIYEYYGASELSFVSYATEEMTELHPHSVGKAFPGVRISIRNQSNELVPNGEIGNIFIESDFLFTGYLNNKKTTSEVLTPYGANIGDLGFINHDGLLTIIGREKNMIITGGLNVYPEEVEKVIKEMKSIKEAIVIGLADEYWGQKVVALIMLNEDISTVDTEHIKVYCKKQLASYKCPKEIHVVDVFPYTSTGKIARKELNLIL